MAEIFIGALRTELVDRRCSPVTLVDFEGNEFCTERSAAERG